VPLRRCNHLPLLPVPDPTPTITAAGGSCHQPRRSRDRVSARRCLLHPYASLHIPMEFSIFMWLLSVRPKNLHRPGRQRWTSRRCGPTGLREAFFFSHGTIFAICNGSRGQDVSAWQRVSSNPNADIVCVIIRLLLTFWDDRSASGHRPQASRERPSHGRLDLAGC